MDVVVRVGGCGGQRPAAAQSAASWGWPPTASVRSTDTGTGPTEIRAARADPILQPVVEDDQRPAPQTA